MSCINWLQLLEISQIFCTVSAHNKDETDCYNWAELFHAVSTCGQIQQVLTSRMTGRGLSIAQVGPACNSKVQINKHKKRRLHWTRVFHTMSTCGNMQQDLASHLIGRGMHMAQVGPACNIKVQKRQISA